MDFLGGFMSPKVAILLADGFEEAEAIIIFNALARVKINVEFVSCQNRFSVISYHEIEIKTHKLLVDVKDEVYDAIVLPGGPDGTVNLSNNPDVMELIKRHDNAGKLICPICSAAVKVLGKNKLLKRRKYTCSGDLYHMPNDGEFIDEDVVIDQNLVSGKGLGIAFKFSFILAEKLNIDSKKVRFQAEHIYVNY